MDGVIKTRVGYTGGGTARQATYATVCAGDGNTEAVRVTYDPRVLSYEGVLRIFFANHDPCGARGPQYKSAIFAASPEHEAAARAALAAEQDRRGQALATQVLPFDEATWHEAEEYHQKYLDRRASFD